jgi:hypothetical protein
VWHAGGMTTPPADDGRRTLVTAVLGVLLVAIGFLLTKTHGTVHLVALVIGTLLMACAIALLLALPAIRKRRE